MAITKTTKTDSTANDIQNYIKAGIEKEARKIADEYKEQIIQDVENAMSDIVAKLSTRLLKHYSVQDMSDRIVIEVRKEFTAPNKTTKGKD